MWCHQMQLACKRFFSFYFFFVFSSSLKYVTYFLNELEIYFGSVFWPKYIQKNLLFGLGFWVRVGGAPKYLGMPLHVIWEFPSFYRDQESYMIENGKLDRNENIHFNEKVLKNLEINLNLPRLIGVLISNHASSR